MPTLTTCRFSHSVAAVSTLGATLAPLPPDAAAAAASALPARALSFRAAAASVL